MRRPARGGLCPTESGGWTTTEFKDVVREAGERRVAQGGLVPIPELRRQVPALDRRAFDDFVLALHREGAIHLLSHVEPDKLSSDVREQCVVHSLGHAPLLAAVAVTDLASARALSVPGGRPYAGGSPDGTAPRHRRALRPRPRGPLDRRPRRLAHLLQPAVAGLHRPHSRRRAGQRLDGGHPPGRFRALPGDLPARGARAPRLRDRVPPAPLRRRVPVDARHGGAALRRRTGRSWPTSAPPSTSPTAAGPRKSASGCCRTRRRPAGPRTSSWPPSPTSCARP